MATFFLIQVYLAIPCLRAEMPDYGMQAWDKKIIH